MLIGFQFEHAVAFGRSNHDVCIIVCASVFINYYEYFFCKHRLYMSQTALRPQVGPCAQPQPLAPISQVTFPQCIKIIIELVLVLNVKAPYLIS